MQKLTDHAPPFPCPSQTHMGRLARARFTCATRARQSAAAVGGGAGRCRRVRMVVRRRRVLLLVLVVGLRRQ